jgi:hypothetical protein
MGPIFKGQEVHLAFSSAFLTLEDGPDRLPRNVGTDLLRNAACHPRTAQFIYIEAEA